jgi:small subunit ribosomal protein S9
MPTKRNATNESSSRAVGRRKEAAARVKIMPGKGVITVNGREMKEYFPTKIHQKVVFDALVVVQKEASLDVSVRVVGGGVAGQAHAVRHGIARALISWNPELRPVLKAEGFLTRDSRAKERKKPGLTKARRGHQWRKR